MVDTNEHNPVSSVEATIPGAPAADKPNVAPSQQPVSGIPQTGSGTSPTQQFSPGSQQVPPGAESSAVGIQQQIPLNAYQPPPPPGSEQSTYPPHGAAPPAPGQPPHFAYPPYGEAPPHGPGQPPSSAYSSAPPPGSGVSGGWPGAVPPQGGHNYQAGQYQQKQRWQGIGSPQKDKWVATVLAFTLGWLGIHKFYLGYRTEGLTMLLIALIAGLCFGLGTIAMYVFAVIEAVHYIILTQEDFERTYVVGYKGWF
ncbi:MAG: NINE protein [Coriobacteriales bacterium]|jgi:TM2 domain-containing membrane protein YozV|nr:NINE protein [Coriobacteriales bacterium]